MSVNTGTVILIGPGGVGKGTVARGLLQRDPRLWLSRSWTTREKRPHETGDEYVFVDRATFESAVTAGKFLEWAQFHDNLYGSPVPTPNPGQRVLLEIEIQGAAQVLAHEPDATVILLEPPSTEDLRERLEGRGDPPDHVSQRLTSTPDELALGRQIAHYVVVNRDIEASVDQILSILGTPRSS